VNRKHKGLASWYAKNGARYVYTAIPLSGKILNKTLGAISINEGMQ
jgi:hypothetical protein